MPVTIDGSNTPTAGGVGYGDGTELAFTSAGSAGQVLLSNGASAPSFGAVPTVNLATGVTGTLPVANGGTGATSLTANNVLLGNGTSAVQVVAPGTNGNVLTSNGTTWTSAAISSGALVLISSQTVSGTPATVDFTSGISSTYDEYMMLFDNVRSSVNSNELVIRLYKSGSFQTSGYNFQYLEARNGTTSSLSGVGGSGATYIQLNSGNTSATNTYQAGRVFLLNVNSATGNACTVMTQTVGMGSLISENYVSNAGGSQNTAAVVTGIRFFWGGGANFSSGTFRLYGVAK